MSRRRTADDNTLTVDEDGLPPPSTDAIKGKQQHTPAARAARFVRTRPVSALLLVLAVCSLALLTFWLGRIVGRALSGVLYHPDDENKHTLKTDTELSSSSKDTHVDAEAAAKQAEGGGLGASFDFVFFLKL